jgi:hypothetical protein
MITIILKPLTGEFAENKDIARDIRTTMLAPVLERGGLVTLDFSDIEGTTQSFVHALISELFRIYGSSALDKIYFKNCTQTVQKIITIVTEYMQEAE